MKCNLCKMKDATVHLTEVINDQMTKLHLCENCAKQKSEEMQSHFGLTDLISGLMELGPSVADEDVQESIQAKCPNCAMTYHDFQKGGKLGCGICYEVFSEKLSDLLRKIHGADRHTGKMPFMGKEMVEDHDKIKQLREEMEALIRSEEFEKAVILRDRIRDIEKKFKGE